MLAELKKSNSRGFTIIEVMIVLAIAGTIMLIVFLAVPALQRNTRNTQRTADASKVAAAITECLSNRNGQVTSCDQLPTGSNELPIDFAKLSQITTVTNGAGMPNWTAFAKGTEVVIASGNKCTDDGVWAKGSSSQRQFVVLYSNEGTGGAQVTRCLDV